MNSTHTLSYLKNSHRNKELESDRTLESVFGRIDFLYIEIMIMYGIVSTFMFFYLPRRLLSLFILVVHLISAVVDPMMCMGNMLTVSLYSNVLFPSSIQVLIEIILTASLIFHNLEITRRIRGSKAVFLGIFLVFASFFVGIASEKNQLIQMLLCIIRVSVIYSIFDGSKFNQGLFGYISSGLCLILYCMLSIINDHNLLIYGRLSFEGEIKTLAIAAAIPMMMILGSRLGGKRLYENVGNLIIDIMLIVSWTTIVILTGARGLLIGFFVGIFVALLFGQKKQSIPLIIGVVLFVSIVFTKMVDPSLFRLNRLMETEEIATGNGRTDIWILYIRNIWNNGIKNVLFGAGPGDVRRLGITTTYAHSTFLDVLFSYGVAGFVYVVIFEVYIIYNCIRYKNVAIMSLNLMLIITYFGHGSATNASLFSLQMMLNRIMEGKIQQTTVTQKSKYIRECK